MSIGLVPYETEEFDIKDIPEAVIKETPTFVLFRDLAKLVEKKKGKIVKFTTQTQANSCMGRLARMGIDGVDGVNKGAKYDVYSQKIAGSQHRYVWMRPMGEGIENP